jgi:SAM-dependent methyltransferase
MMHRRSLLASSAAVATMTTLAPQLAAAAAERPKRLSPRGHEGILDRYPTLHMESHDDLIAGFRKWTNGALKQAADERAIQIFKEHGIDPNADLPMAEALKLIGDDDIIAQSGYAWIDVQRIKYKKYQEFYHRNADRFLSEMEAFDKSGPGSLELNPDMHIPGYCAREIHQQPGGYVGDPFAGHMYHWATIVSADGRNNQDVTHDASAAATPVPADGKVRRILDLGTSIGQYATSLKKRFPDAEVWGIDIGGPMVRYAHMRAVDMGVDVNFAQRLAEDTKFPDNHFDIVASNIMHHEVTAEASKRIFKEMRRVLRPGGLYFPADVYTSAPPPTSAIGKHFMFWTFRWNREDWWLEWADLDKEKAIADAGLSVSRTPAGGPRRANNLVATKA